MNLYRRDFLGLMLGLGFVACSGKSPNDEESGQQLQSCESDRIPATIANNHGHTMAIRHEDLISGVDHIIYGIQGSSNHSHTVTFTDTMLEKLANGESVVASSTSEAGHSHQISVSCIA